MTLHLKLTPEQQERLIEQARGSGVEASEYAHTLLDKALTQRREEAARARRVAEAERLGLPTDHFYFTATDAEWEAALDALPLVTAVDVPTLPHEAFDRENLYEDRL